MTTPTTTPNDFDPTDPKVIADHFLRLLREEIGATYYAEACRLNATETSSVVCHSHDHCDANMVMAAAFEAVGLTPPDADADPELWNDAWAIAFDTMAAEGAAPQRQSEAAPATPYDVVDPDLNQIAAHLTALDFDHVTVEYPGCVCVWAEDLIQHPDAGWWFGTANATWMGDLQTADGQHLGHLETAVPSTETDPKVIAEAIAWALRQPATPTTPTLVDLLERTVSIMDTTNTDNPNETVAEAHDELYRELQVALAGLKGGAR